MTLGVFEFLIAVFVLSGIGAWYRGHTKAREMRHAERMRAIEHGLVPIETGGPWAGLACIGIGALVPIACFGVAVFLLVEGARVISFLPPPPGPVTSGVYEHYEMARYTARDRYVSIFLGLGAFGIASGASLTYLLFRPRRASVDDWTTKPAYRPDPMDAAADDVPEPAAHR